MLEKLFQDCLRQLSTYKKIAAVWSFDELSLEKSIRIMDCAFIYVISTSSPSLPGTGDVTKKAFILSVMENQPQKATKLDISIRFGFSNLTG